MSLLFDFVSLIIAGIALWRSTSAKKAATEALGRRDAQDDMERLVTLVSDLKATKKSVTPWILGMSAQHRAGRDRDTDLDALCHAASSLRTNLPLDADEDLQGKTERSAERLDDLAEQIGKDPKNENLWKSAHLELLTLITSFEKAIRKRKNKLVGE